MRDGPAVSRGPPGMRGDKEVPIAELIEPRSLHLRLNVLGTGSWRDKGANFSVNRHGLGHRPETSTTWPGTGSADKSHRLG